MLRILAIPEYRELFAQVYPDIKQEDLGFQHAANAIAAFEIAGFTFNDSPWDNYILGNEQAITPAASLYMHEEDLRITARADRVPANLAFETLRGHLESKGLVVEENSSTSLLVPQEFTVDRNRIREASVPAAR